MESRAFECAVFQSQDYLILMRLMLAVQRWQSWNKWRRLLNACYNMYSFAVAIAVKLLAIIYFSLRSTSTYMYLCKLMSCINV